MAQENEESVSAETIDGESIIPKSARHSLDTIITLISQEKIGDAVVQLRKLPSRFTLTDEQNQEAHTLLYYKLPMQLARNYFVKKEFQKSKNILSAALKHHGDSSESYKTLLENWTQVSLFIANQENQALTGAKEVSLKIQRFLDAEKRYKGAISAHT